MNKAVTIKHGWRAQLGLRYGLRANRTRLVDRKQYGPLALQRPFYPEGGTCHSYILHPPGGVVGGDSLEIDVRTYAGAHCLLTNPGATKFYRAAQGQRAVVAQRIHVGKGAIVEWLPQPSIFFPGAVADVGTTIDIDGGGRYAGWEINCLGRPANGERFDRGSLHCATRVRVGGELRLVDVLRIDDPQAPGAASGLRGLPMQASFLAAPCTEKHRMELERLLHHSPGREYPHPIGLTLVDEVLVVRALGEQSEPIQRLFTLLWSALRQQWLDKPPCVPRIWST